MSMHSGALLEYVEINSWFEINSWIEINSWKDVIMLVFEHDSCLLFGSFKCGQNRTAQHIISCACVLHCQWKHVGEARSGYLIKKPLTAQGGSRHSIKGVQARLLAHLLPLAYQARPRRIESNLLLAYMATAQLQVETDNSVR